MSASTQRDGGALSAESGGHQRLDVDLAPADASPVDAERVAADLEHVRARAGWRRIVRIGSGIGFLVFGVAGLFLPVLQGVLFIVIGLALLAPDVPIARRAVLWAMRRSRRLRGLLPRRFRRMVRKPQSAATSAVTDAATDESEAAGARDPRAAGPGGPR